MSKRLIVPVVLMAAGLQVVAARTESYVSLGYGALSCATWTTTRAARPKEAETYAAWLYGFVSAYNAYVFRGPNVVEGTDTAALNEWVDGYCKTRGAENLDDAAKSLIAEHVKIMKAKAAENQTTSPEGG